jgi:nucleotide-binding universal stress UspA family protein
MIRSLVVPLDGSRFAERALPVAARIARNAEATLHLVMAEDPTQGLAPFAEFGPPSVLLMEELDRRHTAYLERTAGRLRKAGRIRVKVLYQDGAAGRVIVRAAEATRSGLVVMSTHGRGAFGRIGLGSVADYVVRHLEIPVLLLPPRAHRLRSVPGRRVLVPLDLSPESTAVLDALADLLPAIGAMRVTLLHVVEPVPVVALPSLAALNPDGALAELRWEEARLRLDRAEAAARRLGFTVATRLVAGGRAGATILEHLNRGNYDLLALTTHGYSGFKRLLLGSVTNKVVRHAGKPVLVVRPPATTSRRRASRK